MKRLAILAALGLQAVPALTPTPDVHLATGVLAARALERPIAGISVAVGRTGGFMMTPHVIRGFGFADVARQAPISSNTVFHVASVSKYITAALALRLVEQGRLALDDDITKYVSEAPTQGRRVTIRQLLNHTSGLFSYTALADAAANEGKELSHADVLALIKDKPLDFEPGTSWRYSNTGFYLVGMAVERRTGQPYAALLRDELFGPLSMRSSSLCTARDTVPNLAEGHDVRAGALTATAPMTWTLPFAGGGICSTARDLVQWANALESGRVISAASLALMRTPTVLPDGTRIDYGLGTRLGVLQGRAAVGHTGGGGGFSASLITFPSQKLTVAVLTNTGNGGAIPLAAAIARSAFEIGPPALRDSNVPSSEAAALTGVFESDSGSIEIYQCGRAVCARPPGTEKGQALRRQQAFIYAVDPDLEIRFQPGRRPSEWVFAYNGGLLMDAKRRAPKKPAV